MQDIKALYPLAPLADKLSHLTAFPVTALIAPLGYGKSTALGMFLRRRGIPSLMLTAAALIEQSPAQIPNGTVVVVENYHALAQDSAAEGALGRLVAALDGRCPVVLLSRQDAGMTKQTDLLLHGGLYRIEPESFQMQPDDLQAWSRLCGLALTDAQLQQLAQWSEGWPVLAYLGLLAYQRSGQLDTREGDILMSELYRSLTEPCRKLLWYLSAVIDFTEEDAAALWGSKDGSALLWQLRGEGAPLLRDGSRWHLHAAFAAYVQEQFALTGEANRASVHRRLGRWRQSRGEIEAARQAYEAAGDWDQLLSLLEDDAGAHLGYSYAKQWTHLMLSCPREALSRHPSAQFYFARMIAAFGSPEAVQRWLPASPSQAAMIHAAVCDPDLEQMTRACRSIRESGEKPPSTALEPFTLGRLSLLGSYCRAPGQAQATLKYLEEYLNLYLPLSGNHGAGALEAAQGELAYLCGRFADAAIHAHSAQLAARENQQRSVQTYACFVLARCAFAQRSWDGAKKYLAQLQVAASGSRMLRQTAQLAEAWFSAILGQAGGCPAWLREADVSQTELLPPAYGGFYTVAGAVLLAQKEWPRLIACCERWLQQEAGQQSVLPALYLHLYLAIAYDRLQMPAEAGAALRRALALAQPDGFVMPFAEFGGYLLPLLTPLEQTQFLSACIARCTRYHRNLPRLLASSGALIPGLTARESQVAQLMCEGLSNADIAQQLDININTVKTTIRHINAKLGVQGRQALKARLGR